MLVEPLCAVKDCTFFCSKVRNSQIFNCCLLDSDTQTQFGIIFSDQLQIPISLSLVHWQLLKTLYTCRFFGKSLAVARKRWNFMKNKPFSRGTKGAQLTLVLWQDWEVTEEQQRVFLSAQAWSSPLYSISPHSYIFHMTGGNDPTGEGDVDIPRRHHLCRPRPPLCSTSVRCREISTVPPPVEHVTG